MTDPHTGARGVYRGWVGAAAGVWCCGCCCCGVTGAACVERAKVEGCVCDMILTNLRCCTDKMHEVMFRSGVGGIGVTLQNSS